MGYLPQAPVRLLRPISKARLEQLLLTKPGCI